MRSTTRDSTVRVPPASARSLGLFVADVVERMRTTDAMSHTRALAYQTVFALMSGFIGLVGLASVLDLPELRSLIQHLATRIAPGPSGPILQQAAQQGASGGAVAAVVGLGAAWVSSTLAMAQVQRSADRISGHRDGRSGVRRYAVAALLAIPVGALLALGGLALGAGTAIVDGVGLADEAATVWNVIRWPIGIALVGAGIYLMLRLAPSRRLGSKARLLLGTTVALVLWAAFTLLLAAYFALSSTASQTYGPLLTTVAIVLWAGLTSLAVHVGIASAVEAERR